MSPSYLDRASTGRSIPQSEPVPGSAQVPNSAGGHAWEVDSMERLRRFLILGTEGGSYYAGERDLTKQALAGVRQAIAERPAEALGTIVDVSKRGRAPRNDEAIYALAIAASCPDEATRVKALYRLPDVCRTGTHLLQFARQVSTMRGHGRALNRALGEWYLRDPREVAYQLVKYRQRDGWSHRDVLRLARPTPETALHDELMHFATRGELKGKVFRSGDDADALAPISAYLAAQKTSTPGETAALIAAYGSALPREALQSEHVADPDVQRALLAEGMPMIALMRNLGNLTRHGVIKPLGESNLDIAARLIDPGELRRSRLHPMQVLKALRTYADGGGYLSSNTWAPVPEIVAALDQAFGLAFDNVEPTGARHLLALDVSGSMVNALMGGPLTCREGAAAMAMATARSGDPFHVVAFTGDGMLRGPGRVEDLPVTAGQRLDDVVRMTSDLPFGPTDCALPMIDALERGLEVDVFVVYTDNETWHGSVHPAQALAEYRRRTGIPARLAIVGMVSNGFTIADPADPGMLDLVGFDASAPAVLAQFAAGRI